MSEDIVVRNLVADLASAYFRKARVTPSQIPTVIRQIAASLAAAGASPIEVSAAPPAQPKVNPAQVRKSITRDALISFEDNKPYRTLPRHLAARGLSPDDYRRKWGLPKDYPMAAASYREARAGVAKARVIEARDASNVAPAVLEVKPDPPELEANAAPAEPTIAAVSPATPTQPTLSGPGSLRKSASMPIAFRPRDSVRDPETNIRHKRWLAMLSEMDWVRIRALSRQVNHAHVPPALTDLSAPLRVRACLVGHEARFPGEQVGTLRGGQVAVLISEHGEP